MIKTIMILVISLACVGAYADSEIKNEKGNAKIVEIGKSYAKGKLTPEQVREKIAQWRSSRTDVRNVDDNKRMRNVPRGEWRNSSEHIKHSRGLSKRTEGTDRRDNKRIRGDRERLGNDRRPSEFNSERHRTSSRGQKLQHRPDSRKHRGFRGDNQRDCGRCSKGTGKDRRISRRFGASEQQSRGSHWSDRGTRGPSQRVRTVR